MRFNGITAIRKIIRRIIDEGKRTRTARRNITELRKLRDDQLSDIGVSRIDLERAVYNRNYSDNTIRDR